MKVMNVLMLQWTVHGGETRPRRRSKDLISSKEDAMQEAKEEDEKTEVINKNMC
jgi:hypothetical protein